MPCGRLCRDARTRPRGRRTALRAPSGGAGAAPVRTPGRGLGAPDRRRSVARARRGGASSRHRPQADLAPAGRMDLAGGDADHGMGRSRETPERAQRRMGRGRSTAVAAGPHGAPRVLRTRAGVRRRDARPRRARPVRRPVGGPVGLDELVRPRPRVHGEMAPPGPDQTRRRARRRSTGAGSSIPCSPSRCTPSRAPSTGRPPPKAPR